MSSLHNHRFRKFVCEFQETMDTFSETSPSTSISTDNSSHLLDKVSSTTNECPAGAKCNPSHKLLSALLVSLRIFTNSCFCVPSHTSVEIVELQLDSYLSQKKDVSNLLWLYVSMLFMASMFGLQYTMIKASGQLEQIFFGYNLYLPLPVALFVAYSCVCASRLSIISEDSTVFRFNNDHPHPCSSDAESLHSPTLTKSSHWSILTSFIWINWYLMGVAVALYGLNHCLDRHAGPLPHTFVSVFYPTLYFGGFFLYTLQIFDIGSNIMLMMCILLVSFVKNPGDGPFGSVLVNIIRSDSLCVFAAFVYIACAAIYRFKREADNKAKASAAGQVSTAGACVESDLESNGNGVLSCLPVRLSVFVYLSSSITPMESYPVSF
jgi:hypothetical protein